MFIDNTGGFKIIEAQPFKITLAMSDPTGSVKIEQQGKTKNDWFGYVSDGDSSDLSATNTAATIENPIRLKITATGTGVRIYSETFPNQIQNIIQK